MKGRCTCQRVVLAAVRMHRTPHYLSIAAKRSVSTLSVSKVLLVVTSLVIIAVSKRIEVLTC